MKQNGTEISQQAIEWLINLQETPDDKELLERFTAWYQESVEHRLAWDEANAVWNTLGELNPAPALVADVTPAINLRSPRRRIPQLLSLAATIVFAVVLYFPITQWFTADYYTGTGEMRQIALDDGSTVWLGAKSAIKIHYQANTRNIELLAGEAYFSVQPDPSRPFHVITDMADTTVLGTAFNVNLVADTFSIAVNHGRVAVTAHGSSELLRPPLKAGNWLRLNNTGNTEWGNTSPDAAGIWRSGKLVVNNRPVGEVLDELRRYYRGAIMLTDTSVATRRLTGVYDLKTPDNALQAIAKVQDLKLTRITPWVALLSPN